MICPNPLPATTVAALFKNNLGDASAVRVKDNEDAPAVEPSA
jgi:hypothetical protein